MLATVGAIAPAPILGQNLEEHFLCEPIRVGSAGPPIAVPEAQLVAGAPQPVTIDLMVLFSSAAVREGYHSWLNATLTEVNRIYRDTGITFRLVGVYAISQGSVLDRAAAAGTAGHATTLVRVFREPNSQFAATRSRIGADLVLSWAVRPTGVDGQALAPFTRSAFNPANGYAVLRGRALHAAFTAEYAAHELGHNLGLDHQASSYLPATVFLSYARSYQGSHASLPHPYITVMGARRRADGSAFLAYRIPELSSNSVILFKSPYTDESGLNLRLGDEVTRARDAATFTGPWVANYVAAVKSAGEAPDDPDGLLPPVRPTGLSAVPGNRQVVLSWTDPKDPGIIRYSLQQRKGAAAWSSWTEIDGSDASTKTHAVTGLENGSEYHFRLRTKDSIGASPVSETVAATPSADSAGVAPEVTVSLSAADVTAVEGGTFAFVVTADPAPAAEVSFSYTVTAASGDTATADTDFTAVTTATATIAAGETSTTITVAVTDDDLDETDETFTMTLSAPSDGATIGAAAATGTITDDDASPVLSPVTDRAVTLGQTVDITAVATDGDNDAIAYAWSRAAGETSPAIPGGTVLDQARLTFTTTAPGTYTLTVTASDGNGNSDTEDVTITVRQADPVGDGTDGGGSGPPGSPGGNDGSSDGGDPGGNDGSSGDGPGPPSDPGGNDGSSGGGSGPPSDPGGNDGSSGGGSGPPSDPGGDDGGSSGPGGTGGGNGDPAGGGNGPGGNGGGSGADSDDDDDDDDDDRGGPGGNDDGESGGADEAVRASFTLDAPCADGLCRARTGVPVSFRDGSSGAVTSRTWNFGDGATSRSRSLEHAWTVPGFYTVSLTVSGQGPSSTVSRKVLVEAADPVGACAADAETLCLQDSRFSVTMDWWTEDGADGRRGAGKVVHEGTNDSGLFWFFSSVNWELLVKVLDGCSVNGRMWVYGASATTLGYSLTVTDTVTGAAREYRNEPGRQAEAFTDSAAFPGSCADAATAAAAAGDSASPPVAEPSSEPLPEPLPAQHLAAATVPVASPVEDDGCTATATAMCLQQGRYEVTVTWSSHDGLSGKGRTAGPRTDDSGLFHFFSPANWEILVKLLDGCSFNDHHWVFAASATDVGFDLRVRDTMTGRVRQYTRQAGKPALALVDISAFPEVCRQP